jgi:hypothetical protein
MLHKTPLRVLDAFAGAGRSCIYLMHFLPPSSHIIAVQKADTAVEKGTLQRLLHNTAAFRRVDKRRICTTSLQVMAGAVRSVLARHILTTPPGAANAIDLAFVNPPWYLPDDVDDGMQQQQQQQQQHARAAAVEGAAGAPWSSVPHAAGSGQQDNSKKTHVASAQHLLEFLHRHVFYDARFRPSIVVLKLPHLIATQDFHRSLWPENALLYKNIETIHVRHLYWAYVFALVPSALPENMEDATTMLHSIEKPSCCCRGS